MLGKGVLRLGGLLTIGRVLQVASALVLIKLLTPVQMGSVGILTAVFVGVYSLTNFGFDRYLIHADEVDISCATVNNIWTLQLIRGVVVLFVCILMGYVIPSVSDFDNTITAQLITIGLALLIYNCANPEVSLFERNGSFNQTANCRGFSMIAGALIVTVSAYVLASPWAYVFGQLASTLFYALLTFHYSEGRPRLSFDRLVVRKIFKYCKHLLILAVVSVIAVQFENYYIAFAFGAETLGFYFTWARLVYMPRELIVQISDRVLFATACSSRRCGTPLIREHLLICTLAAIIVLPFYEMIWFYGEWFIGIVAGNEWVPYHWVGKFFVVISSVWLLALLFSPLVLANYPKVSSILRSAEVSMMIVLMLWLGNLYGVKGVLIASLIGIIIALIIRLFIVYRYVIAESWHRHILVLVFIVSLGVGGFSGSDYLYGFGAVNAEPGIAFIACSAFVSCVTGVIAWILYRPFKMGVKVC